MVLGEEQNSMMKLVEYPKFFTRQEFSEFQSHQKWQESFSKNALMEDLEILDLNDLHMNSHDLKIERIVHSID